MEELSFRQRSERTWLLSPAAVTALFFIVQVYIAFQSPDPWSSPGRGDEPTAAAAAERPKSGAVRLRTVAQIKPAAPRPEVTDIPESEAELWALFQRDGQVMFFSDEVEVLRTPAQRFGVEEVGVITVEGDDTEAQSGNDEP